LIAVKQIDEAKGHMAEVQEGGPVEMNKLN
jgi:hypothetical protein